MFVHDIIYVCVKFYQDICIISLAEKYIWDPKKARNKVHCCTGRGSLTPDRMSTRMHVSTVRTIAHIFDENSRNKSNPNVIMTPTS